MRSLNLSESSDASASETEDSAQETAAASSGSSAHAQGKIGSQSLEPQKAPLPSYATNMLATLPPSIPVPPGLLMGSYSRKPRGEGPDSAPLLGSPWYVQLADQAPQLGSGTRSNLRSGQAPQLGSPRHVTLKRGAVALDGTEISAKAERLPEMSIGAEGHYFGQCKPCGWFWKVDGCSNGKSCPFCHLCPDGSIQGQRSAQRLRQKNAEAERKRGQEVEPVVKRKANPRRRRTRKQTPTRQELPARQTPTRTGIAGKAGKAGKADAYEAGTANRNNDIVDQKQDFGPIEF